MSTTGARSSKSADFFDRRLLATAELDRGRTKFSSTAISGRSDGAAAATDPTLARVAEIVREAARTRTRRLILLSGVPGSGKTLVGLQVAHSHGLMISRFPARMACRRPPSSYPAMGRWLRCSSTSSEAAVAAGRRSCAGSRNMSSTTRSVRICPFPRACTHLRRSTARVRRRDGRREASRARPRTQPEHFVEFAERVPEWCVVIGLIGTGQEIHVGEEGGAVQWRWAVERSRRSADSGSPRAHGFGARFSWPSPAPSRATSAPRDRTPLPHSSGQSRVRRETPLG